MIESSRCYNRRYFVILATTVGVIFLFKNSVSGLLLKLGNLIDYHSWAFYIGYFILIALALIISIRSACNQYIPHKNLTFFIIIIVFLYIDLRIFETDTICLLAENNYIKYADIVPIIGIIYGINLLMVHLKKPESKKKDAFFLQDTLFENEELTNEKILQQLIKSLTSFKPDIAFSIGINAVWGYGKSSFLYKFKKDYPKTNPKAIVFWYRVWKNKGVNAIIENFFEELSASLQPFSGELNSEFNGYVDAILQLPSTEISKLITMGRGAINGKETLEKHFISINSSIAKIDRQIIILLDDMDRLEREEILSTLKLIRTLSDFNNLIFIVGYDRQYIVETIQKPKENYLDKVFNVEINLLPFDENLLTQHLFSEFDKLYPKKASETDTLGFSIAIKKLFEKGNNVFPIDINLDLFLGNVCSKHELSCLDFLETFRDVKRFINEFRFNEGFLDSRNDVIASEYILLKLLTYKYRYVQELVFNKMDAIFSKGTIDWNSRKIEEGYGFYKDIWIYSCERKIIGKDSDGNQIFEESTKEKLKTIFLKEGKEDDFEVVNAVLCHLFGRGSIDFYSANQNSISKIYYTDLYLRNNIAAGLITISQVQKAFRTATLHELMQELEENGSENGVSIKNELKYFVFGNKPANKAQFEDVISLLSSIISLGIHSDDEKVLEILKLGSEEFYKEDEDFSNFLKHMLCNQPRGYLSNLLSEINTNEKRKENKELYSNEILDYKNNFFQQGILDEIILESLDCLIKKSKCPNEITHFYNQIVGRIVADKKILKPNKVNEIMKIDITNRFIEYYSSNIFNSISGYASRNDLHFEGIGPYTFFSQIFSDSQSNTELLKKKVVSEKDFEDYLDDGWSNFQTFLENLPIMEEDGYSQERLNNTRKTIKAFIDNNYRGLNEKQYSEIWGDTINKGFGSKS